MNEQEAMELATRAIIKAMISSFIEVRTQRLIVKALRREA
jgi:hypothetical protein